MANYKLDSIDLNAGRSELHNALALTGCEVSCNNLPAGVAVPFVHSHKNNEECYLVLGGDGIFYIDGEELPIKAGSCFRVDPAGRRCLKAGKNGLRYLCIQSARNSLKGFTMTDGVVEEGAKAPKPRWM